MTTSEYMHLLNKSAFWIPPLSLVRIKVRIVDVKVSYGNTRYLITPVSGEGEQWTNNIILEGA